HISTGDLLRSEISAGTPLGKEAQKFINKGQLVPDEVVIGMISEVLDNNTGASGFIFDGFPRTVAQAVALDKLLSVKNTSIAVLLALEVPEEELIKRLLKRGETSGRSDDANEEVIRARIQEYRDKTATVAAYYDKAKKLRTVKGEGSIEEIFGLLSDKITPLAEKLI